MSARPRPAVPASWALLPLLAAGGCAPPVVVGTAPALPAAYVVRLGSDTVAVEQFTRTPTRIEGDYLVRQPTTTIYHYVVTMGPDGRPERYDVTPRRPDGSLAPNTPRSISMRFGRDSVSREITGDSVVRQQIAAANAYPVLGNSVALTEIALGAVRASGQDSASVLLLSPGARSATAWPMRLLGRDSARVWYFGDPQYLRLNPSGHLVGLDASQTTNKIVIEPVSSVDIPVLAQMFAAREQHGQGFGATTRDTVTTQLGGASLWLDYGRPLARGRTLFTANGVLGDTLWRTGANAATQLRTDRELMIGNAVVPPGTYTLFTAARGGQYQLIINRQSGQWGTEYHAERDLARIPLTASTLATPVERFTIAIEPQGGSNGILALQWGTMRLTTPVVVR